MRGRVGAHKGVRTCSRVSTHTRVRAAQLPCSGLHPPPPPAAPHHWPLISRGRSLHPLDALRVQNIGHMIVSTHIRCSHHPWQLLHRVGAASVISG